MRQAKVSHDVNEKRINEKKMAKKDTIMKWKDCLERKLTNEIGYTSDRYKMNLYLSDKMSEVQVPQSVSSCCRMFVGIGNTIGPLFECVVSVTKYTDDGNMLNDDNVVIKDIQVNYSSRVKEILNEKTTLQDYIEYINENPIKQIQIKAEEEIKESLDKIDYYSYELDRLSKNLNENLNKKEVISYLAEEIERYANLIIESKEKINKNKLLLNSSSSKDSDEFGIKEVI